MIKKTLLILPSGKINIDGKEIQYDDKFDTIKNCFDNPLLPKPDIIYDNDRIGVAKNYTTMEDGLYFEIELFQDTDIENKYPSPKFSGYTDNKGEHWPYFLRGIVFFDSPQYDGQQNKELAKNNALSSLNPGSYSTKEEWLNVCIPSYMRDGKSQDQAIAACFSMWEKRGRNENQKSKLEILNYIKKIIEKNGYSISEEKILEMFGVIQDSKLTLNKIGKKLNLESDVFEIKVFPRKEVYIEKYDEKVVFDSNLFSQMISSFKCEKLFKPYVDVDHRLEEKYADIVDLYELDNGLFAKIRLNERGKEAIKNNDYSYISPEWGDRVDTDGKLHKNVLWAITLTNIPALEGENPRLQDQIQLSKKQKLGEKNMKTLNQRVSVLEGKISNYKLQGEQPQQIPQELLDALEMLKEAMIKIDELTMRNEESVEEVEAAKLKQETAEKIAEDYKSKYDKIEQEKTEKEKGDFFNNALSKGWLHPADKEDWEKQYDKSKEFVVKILSRKDDSTTQNIKTLQNHHNLDNVDVLKYRGKKFKFSDFDYKLMKQHGFDREKRSDLERYVDEVGDVDEV